MVAFECIDSEVTEYLPYGDTLLSWSNLLERYDQGSGIKKGDLKMKFMELK